jgi:hypothetical protein
LLDEADFDRFVATVDPLLKPGRDVLWVLAGRTESNHPKLRKILAKYRLNVTVFHLCYNTKQMQSYGYWKRMRGIGNSKTLEQALYVYKGKIPKNLPKNRVYVDGGSALFNQVLRNVPVLAPKHQSFVSKGVREQSLSSMLGVPHTDDLGERENFEDDDDAMGLDQSNGDAEQDKVIESAQKKRKLYRHHSGTDVPWFPHDNDMELLRELCWEAGNPRWVFHGTPAGGAGVLGCLEAGCSVVALCYDDHHRTHLKRIFLERAVEAMVTGTTQVFKDEALLARSIELHVTTSPKAASAASSAASRPDVKDSEGEEEIEAKPKKAQGQKAEKRKKERKPKAKATRKKKVAANDIDASDSESDSSDSESDDEPPAKKAKKV